MTRLRWLQAARHRRVARALDEIIVNIRAWEGLCSAGRPDSREARRAWKRLELSLTKSLAENSE